MAEDTFHLGVKGLIRDAAGNILLLRVNPAKLKGDRKDYWDLPGGRVQKRQSIEETLVREIAEETGVSAIKNTKEVGMVLSNIRIPVQQGSVGLILAVYACEFATDQPIAISDEHIAYDWFTPEKTAELLAVKYPQHFCELVAAL